jgi:hypothetical protein
MFSVAKGVHLFEWPNEDLAIAYFQPCGATHVLDAFSILLIRLLQTANSTVKQLEMGLKNLISEEDQHLLLGHINSTLLQLQDIDLVKCNPVESL